MPIQFLKPLVCECLMIMLLSTIAVSLESDIYGDEGSGDSAVSATYNESDQVTTASGSNRFVVWFDESPGNPEILFKRSTDNGATWKTAVNLGKNPGQSVHPEIATAGSHIYVIWIQLNLANTEENIFFRHSPDNGVSWDPKVKLSNGNQDNNPRIEAHGNNVYVTWLGPGGTLFKRSTDNGSTWKPVQNLSGSTGGQPQMAVFGDNVYVAWRSSTEPPGVDIFATSSTDEGATWGPVVNLSNAPFREREVILAAEDSNVYAVWSEMGENSSEGDVKIRRSTDRGATWKAAVNLSHSSTISELPELAVSGDNVYVTWKQDKLDSPTSNINFRASANDGATWAAKKQLAVVEEGIPVGPRFATHENVVHVAWSDGPELNARTSADAGLSWSSSKRLSDGGHLTGMHGTFDIICTGSTVMVAWGDYVSEKYDILYRRSTDDGASWNPRVNLSNNAQVSSDPRLGL